MRTLGGFPHGGLFKRGPHRPLLYMPYGSSFCRVKFLGVVAGNFDNLLIIVYIDCLPSVMELAILVASVAFLVVSDTIFYIAGNATTG